MYRECKGNTHTHTHTQSRRIWKRAHSWWEWWACHGINSSLAIPIKRTIRRRQPSPPPIFFLACKWDRWRISHLLLLRYLSNVFYAFLPIGNVFLLFVRVAMLLLLTRWCPPLFTSFRLHSVLYITTTRSSIHSRFLLFFSPFVCVYYNLKIVRVLVLFCFLLYSIRQFSSNFFSLLARFGRCSVDGLLFL